MPLLLNAATNPGTAQWTEASALGLTAGRVAGPTVTASASPLGATAVDQGYREIQIDGYISASTGIHFVKLLLGAGGAPSTANADYYDMGVNRFTSGSVSNITRPDCPLIGLAYQTTAIPVRFCARIQGYSESGRRKCAFYESWSGPGPGAGLAQTYTSGVVAFAPTGPITQVQISVRDSSSSVGTEQNCTGTYTVTYLV